VAESCGDVDGEGESPDGKNDFEEGVKDMFFNVKVMLIALVFGYVLVPAVAMAQSANEPPRLSDGRPDLQGVWDFKTITPLQRPVGLGDRAELTEEEAASLEAQVERSQTALLESIGGKIGAYNAFWFDIGTNVVESRQTSLIIDPPDGRLPSLVEGAVRQSGSLVEDIPGDRPVRYRSGGIGLDGPEDRALAERCLVGFNSGPPMMPSGYNNNMQLFQTSDYVVILNEMVHDARIIPLDGREHLDGLRQWMGDSRGSWDGDTLVVESRNFTDFTSSFDPGATGGIGTGETLHLIERFTRLDENTLVYEYTVNDPNTFTRPFTVALPMRQLELPIFEYACHEGNYGMLNLLSGARAKEVEPATP